MAGRAVREVALEQQLEGRHLRVAEQHAQQRPRQAALAVRAREQVLARGHRLVVAVEQPGSRHVVDQADELLVAARAAQAVEAQRQRLAGVVRQHQVPDLVGHLGQDAVALVAALHEAALDELVEQDLDVHLVVGGVDAARVVDRVGVARGRPRPSTRAGPSA
jgi:hypothetical protein